MKRTTAIIAAAVLAMSATAALAQSKPPLKLGGILDMSSLYADITGPGSEAAAKMAAETNSVPVMKLFSQTLTVIVDGEIAQLLGSRCKADRVNYNQRIYAKTASLFETSAQAAAQVSRGPDERETMRGFFALRFASQGGHKHLFHGFFIAANGGDQVVDPIAWPHQQFLHDRSTNELENLRHRRFV